MLPPARFGATMTLLPVVSRELSVVARRAATYWMRVGLSFASLLGMAWILVTSWQAPQALQGRMVFQSLATFGFVYAICAGIPLASDCISREKREGTLGLLFLTDLRGYDDIFGKMASSALNGIYVVLALLP